ncbi:hypothetical protein K432DRAFT_387216 [Lepidopterella palustris CBS 459.81]|uniref:Uncharacterized protein n=1 Tax=Lepidopterella palustris CBS 459.81 TaxID=1314670 RepID=A0A8E2J8Z1_9PEZI|nr:hypothetical protein K432DRAFT_387216 [Lepidopterella palustris CBS 459.81]
MKLQDLGPLAVASALIFDFPWRILSSLGETRQRSRHLIPLPYWVVLTVSLSIPSSTILRYIDCAVMILDDTSCRQTSTYVAWQSREIAGGTLS